MNRQTQLGSILCYVLSFYSKLFLGRILCLLYDFSLLFYKFCVFIYAELFPGYLLNFYSYFYTYRHTYHQHFKCYFSSFTHLKIDSIFKLQLFLAISTNLIKRLHLKIILFSRAYHVTILSSQCSIQVYSIYILFL